MDILKNMIVLDIKEAITVFSEKGRNYQMRSRTGWGLSFCQSGQITYTMNGKKYISNTTNAVLLPRNGHYHLHGDKTGYFPLINFECTYPYGDTIRLYPLENPEACFKLYDRLKELSANRENKLKLFSTFYQLLDSIAGTHPSGNPLLQTAIAYIEENLADPALSNDAVATHTGISEVYLRKLFSNHQSTTPKQYILDARIRRAKQLLSDPAQSVTTVAEQCGFSGVYHFCRVFRQKCGCTPGNYARENRIEMI